MKDGVQNDNSKLDNNLINEATNEELENESPIEMPKINDEFSEEERETNKREAFSSSKMHSEEETGRNKSKRVGNDSADGNIESKSNINDESLNKIHSDEAVNQDNKLNIRSSNINENRHKKIDVAPALPDLKTYNIHDNLTSTEKQEDLRRKMDLDVPENISDQNAKLVPKEAQSNEHSSDAIEAESNLNKKRSITWRDVPVEKENSNNVENRSAPSGTEFFNVSDIAASSNSDKTSTDFSKKSVIPSRSLSEDFDNNERDILMQRSNLKKPYIREEQSHGEFPLKKAGDFNEIALQQNEMPLNENIISNSGEASSKENNYHATKIRSNYRKIKNSNRENPSIREDKWTLTIIMNLMIIITMYALHQIALKLRITPTNSHTL
ncbi:hypothetical protein CEXT_638931 [Caerostris extrusa]|uniref:Uncharacterized protein n=1 Tax=Caerostris extrusa TaxID=172846 RepID=A0AAV4R6J4_CAEEX|nr:hypothetical protein CEXT_638931 [Caerostris extrusa]